MTSSLDFLSRSDIYAAQYSGGAHQGLIDRIVDWVISAVTGTDRKHIVDLVNDLCSKDSNKASAACDKLRDMLGEDQRLYFTHGEDGYGNLFTEFHPPIYNATITVDRGPAGHMSHYVIDNAFRSGGAEQTVLDAYFPYHGSDRDLAQPLISSLFNPYSTDASKFQSARALASMKDTCLSHRVTVNGSNSVDIDFGLQPLINNFSLKMDHMEVNKTLMHQCIMEGVAEDLRTTQPLFQLLADIKRDDYYCDGVLVSIRDNPMDSIDDFVSPLKNAGATPEQIEVLTTVATQRVYGMILPSLTWDKSPMIPSTSPHGGESKFEASFEGHDNSVRLYITRRLDVCAGLPTRLTEADVDCHYEMMQDDSSPIVKSLETKIALRINRAGGIQIIGDPTYTYNPNVPSAH